MKYKYYLGPSGSGKSYRLKQDIIELSKRNPEKNYLLIVPDQYTMQEQINMVRMHDCRGIMNIDVLSFGRLSHKIFDEVGAPKEVVLDDTGKNLILRKVSIGIKDKLPYLGSSLAKPGYIHQVKSAISEFMQYGYLPEDIDKISKTIEGRGALKAKLADLSLLYDRFQEYKKDHYITTEETLGLLANCISKSTILKDAVIIFDGFTGFTPVQKQVLLALYYRSDEIWFSFTSDTTDTNLFELTQKTIKGIDALFGNDKRNHLEDVILESTGKRFESEELRTLERNLFRKNIQQYQKNVENIEIFESKNPQDEIDEVCSKIRNLVKNYRYAYHDIAVVTGDLEKYTPYIEKTFNKFDIPVFVDCNRHLKFNPFTELIKSALNVIKQNFSYQSMMHLLRTGMTDIAIEDIDFFDNYLIAMKIRGYNAYSREFVKIPASYRVKGENSDSISEETRNKMLSVNTVREYIVRILEPLTLIMKGENSVSDYTKALITFIEGINSEKKLEKLKDYFAENEDYVREKEYSQVYAYIINLLQQCDGLLGDEKMDIEEYSLILEAGIDEIKVGVLPGEIDYVLFGDIERSRLDNIKALFFVGVNDGIIPKNAANGGIISDIDRNFLHEKKEVELAPTPREQMFNQRLYLYMNMTKPSEKLYLSYSRTGSDGKALRKSYLIESVSKLFAKGIETKTKDITAKYPVGEKAFMDSYSDLIRKYASGEIDEEQKKILFALNDIAVDANIFSNLQKEVLEKIREAAFFVHEDRNLTASVAKGIYGVTLLNSISRLEKYASCAFAHFLQYGLKLDEREEYEVRNLDMGNIYHKVMEEYALMLKKEKIKWGEETREKSAQLVDEIFEKVVPYYNENVFYQDERNKYQIEKMKKIILRSVETMGYQLSKGSFKPRLLEMGFKHAIDAKDVKTGLSESEKMFIVGKVDRVDTYEKDNDIYVKIVDYKSSGHKIDLIQFYNGLSLQLVVYLDQTVKKLQKENPEKRVHPSAMYYYTVSDPIVEKKDVSDDIDALIRNKMKLTGFAVDDDDIIEKIAGEFEKQSDVINAKRKVDGTFDANSEVLDENKMDTILKYSEYKTKKLAENIISGDISVSPCDTENCTYCMYKGICGFDVRIAGYKERKMENPGNEIFEKMKEEADGE